MKFFPPPTRILLYSNLTPDECARRLSRSIDLERYKPFSITGYHGSNLFLGMVDGYRFRVLERTWVRNLPPVLLGEFREVNGGTCIEGQFDLDLSSPKNVLLGFGLAAACLFSAVSLYVVGSSVNFPVGVLLACSDVVLLLVLPRILRGMGKGQERDIEDFLCTKLEAGQDASAFKSGSDS